MASDFRAVLASRNRAIAIRIVPSPIQIAHQSSFSYSALAPKGAGAASRSDAFVPMAVSPFFLDAVPTPCAVATVGRMPVTF